MCSHAPTKGGQMVRYYGHYINVVRGKRKKTDADDKISCILEPELTDKAFRRNWARLIQKIYEVDPLICLKCSGAMRVIAFIEDPDVIKKILKHLDLWNVKPKPRSLANAPPSMSFPYTTSRRVPARMITSGIRITLQRPIFKNRTRAVRLPMPKILYFQVI